MLAYWMLIPRLAAEREMRERRAQSAMSAERLYELTLAQTGDRAKAERAFIDYRAEELRRGITPGGREGAD